MKTNTESVRVASQFRTYRADYTENGKPFAIVAKVRWDDQCNNGRNSFSVTGTIYGPDRYAGEETTKTPDGKTLWSCGCGCIHDQIKARLPELAHLIRWHLFNPHGPMHYIANTVYFAGEKDHHGLIKGERRQLKNGKTGLPAWVLEKSAELPKYVDAETCPTETAVLRYVPWERVGEGKARELDAARLSACWPEATDADLTAPGLEDRLMARLPSLLSEFRRDVEALGFKY